MMTVGRRLLVGLAAGACTVLLGLFPPAEYLELKGYDFFHALRKKDVPPADFVLVTIDEPSFAEIGLQWPWPRSLHARLIDALSSGGAAVIALDILFAEASPPAEDEALAGALRRAGNVVLASDIETSSQSGYAREMVIEPYRLFAAEARSGIAKVALDRDNTVRCFYPTRQGEKLFAEQIADLAGKSAGVPAGACISFRYPPGSFGRVSYYQALEPRRFLPADYFRGKIVVVGKSVSSATGATSDYFATPFMLGGGLMSGPELHATMAEGIIGGRYVRRAPPAARAAVLMVLALAAGLSQIGRTPLRGASAAGAGLAAYLAAAFIFFGRGLWLPTLAAVPAFLLPYGYAVAEAYLQAERKRRELRLIFGRYLSPAVLDSILAAPDDLKLGGRRAEATVLFSDIAGFTTLSETMPPEDVASMLNLYFTAMAREIFEERGTIDKFIGDGVMAFWGVPLPDEQHALRACRAALGMQRAISDLVPILAARGYPGISARIGINTGEVVAGNIGSDELFSYTVMGDTVNIASRLEGANKEFGTGIIVSGPVYERVQGGVEVRPLGKIRVKGRAEEVVVYELLGCREDSRRAPG